MQINRPNFWDRNKYFWRVSISRITQNHWKKASFVQHFSFNLTLEHIKLQNFCLWNCLWTANAYRLIVQKVFLFQMLGETSIFTLPCHFDKNFKTMFCVAIWTWMSPLTYWNINSSSKILVLQWLLGIILFYCNQKVK